MYIVLLCGVPSGANIYARQDKGLSVMHRPEEVTEWLKVLWCNTAKSPLIKDDVAYAEK